MGGRSQAMKHIPEINHCLPNAKAYWCSKCKAHNPYTYSTSETGDSHRDKIVLQKFGCSGCHGHMFHPAETTPWMYGLVAFTFLMIILSFYISDNPHVLSGGEFGDTDGLIYCMLGLGTFSGLIGGMMVFHMRKWVGWSWAQRLKSAAQLEEDSLNHPVQSQYEESEDFVLWAKQFLSPDEVNALKEKYGTQQED